MIIPGNGAPGGWEGEGRGERVSGGGGDGDRDRRDQLALEDCMRVL